MGLCSGVCSLPFTLAAQEEEEEGVETVEETPAEFERASQRVSKELDRAGSGKAPDLKKVGGIHAAFA